MTPVAVALRNDWHGRALLSALRTMPQVDLGESAGAGTGRGEHLRLQLLFS